MCIRDSYYVDIFISPTDVITISDPIAVTRSDAGIPEASDITLDTSNFDGNLSDLDDDVQTAMQTIDDVDRGSGSGDGTLTGIDAGTGITVTDNDSATPEVSVTNPFTDADEAKLDSLIPNTDTIPNISIIGMPADVDIYRNGDEYLSLIHI